MKQQDPFYRSARWMRVRDLKRKRNPLCEVCESKGRVVPLAIIHHVVPWKDGGPKFDADNLQSLCRPCHGAAHGTGGEGRFHLQEVTIQNPASDVFFTRSSSPGGGYGASKRG